MKGCKVVLTGIAALGVAGVVQGKVIVLDGAAPNTGAAIHVNYEPAAESGMKTFRVSSGPVAPEKLSRTGQGGSLEATVANPAGTSGITDACATLLTICGLAVYQLHRKQQLLKHLPLSS
jgi:hypothetical protein